MLKKLKGKSRATNFLVRVEECFLEEVLLKLGLEGSVSFPGNKRALDILSKEAVCVCKIV